MQGTRISSRYAKSLLDLSIEKNIVDAVYADMELIKASIEESRELRLMLSSPIIKTDTKEAVINKLFGTSINEITLSFVLLLARKGRESMLHSVTTSFVEQVKRHKHIVTANVTSATPLSPEIQKEIEQLTSKLASGTVEINMTVDPSLIGGFVLKVGDQQVDTSVQSQIKKLKRDFSENPYIAEI